MRAGLNKLLIAALVLVSSLISFSAISLADDPPGMWHSASEIGPGTFKDGNYAFGLSNINFGRGTNLTGNASMDFSTMGSTYVPPTSGPGYTNYYGHNLKFPDVSYGLSLTSNSSALYVRSYGGTSASFYTYAPRTTTTAASYFYIQGYGPGNDYSAIKAFGRLFIRGDIIPDDNHSPKRYELGSPTNLWNATHTRWLCLNGDCKNAWPTGGGTPGGVPNLNQVTSSCATEYGGECGYAENEITTGGLKLKTGAVIRSVDGNVIIKLGS